MDFIVGVNQQLREEQPKDCFEHFIVIGTVKVKGSPKQNIKIFRVAGAIQNLILKGELP